LKQLRILRIGIDNAVRQYTDTDTINASAKQFGQALFTCLANITELTQLHLEADRRTPIDDRVEEFYDDWNRFNDQQYNLSMLPYLNKLTHLTYMFKVNEYDINALQQCTQLQSVTVTYVPNELHNQFCDTVNQLSLNQISVSTVGQYTNDYELLCTTIATQCTIPSMTFEYNLFNCVDNDLSCENCNLFTKVDDLDWNRVINQLNPAVQN
jgi:hypothetical protein